MSIAKRKARPAASKQRLRLWLSLLRTSRYLEAKVREKLRVELDSTLPRFDVLSALDRNRGGMLMSELSGHLMVSNGNVTGIVDRLVEDGLVRRLAVVGDRRATRVVVTKAGITAFAEMANKHEDWIDALLSDVSSADAQHVIDTLSTIRKDEV